MEAFTIEQSLQEGEKEIKELFDFIREQGKELEAYEVECMIFSRIRKIGLCALKGYFAEKGTGDIGPQIALKNGEVLNKTPDLRGKDYFSVFGKLKVPRSYYYKKGYEGVMPLDAQANLPRRCYSYLLQEWLDLFSIRDSFSEAEISLEKLLGLQIKQSRIELVNRESSESYDKFYEGKEIPDPQTEGKYKVISFDGKGVPVIKKEAVKLKARLGKGEKRQKKKESLVGISYTVDSKVRTAEDTAENLVYPERVKEKREQEHREPVKAKNIRRMASLERSKQKVMEEIIRDAKMRDPEEEKKCILIMDGALHLWNKAEKLLLGSDYIGILDIIHVAEYLWNVANALYGEKNSKGTQWVYDHLLSILQGRVGRVIGGLRQILRKRSQELTNVMRKTLKDAITYFCNHRPWMKYDQYLRAGYPIGSGIVESSCALVVKNRMEGIGRRWSIKGAESTLLLRSVYTSGDWNVYWGKHRSLEKDRLYGRVLTVLDSAA